MKNSYEKPPITPSMKVGDLLKHYPELEDTLLELSPAFAKLKNPVLRRTVARVATLGQAAAVGDLKIADLINKLRKAAGSEEWHHYEGVIDDTKSKPQWFEKSKIAESFDAREMIEKGEQPLTMVIRKLNNLEDGKILELITPFYPAPIVDKAGSMGFEIWSDKIDNGLIKTYFHKIS